MPDEEKTTIASAVAAADASVDGEVKNGETPPTTETPKPDEKKAEKTPEDEDAVKGKQLLEALKNPDTALQVAEFLAKQAGFSLAKITNDKKAEAAKDDILDTLKEELGPEFDYLSEKLGKAIGKILSSKVTEHTQDIRQKLEEKEVKELRDQGSAAQAKLAQDYFDKDELPEDVVADMSKLMERIAPSGNQSIDEYLKDIFFSVMGRRGNKLTTKDQRAKINKNRDSLDLRGARRAVPDGEDKPTKYNSISEAVAAAEEAVRSEK